MDWSRRDRRSCRSLHSEKPIYADYARHHGLSQNVFAIDVSPQSGAGFVVTVLRPDRAGEFEESSVQLLTTLRPHIHRALQMHTRLSESAMARRMSEAALEHLSVGVLLFDSTGSLTYANTAARTIGSTRDGLVLQARQAMALCPRDNARFQSAMRQCVHTINRQALSAGAALQIARPSGQRPLTVLISPLAIADVGAAGAAAVAFVIDPEKRAELGGERLTQLYGLTRAETAVCTQLASGLSLAEIAERLNITRETARTHLKRILSKTGTHRQAELTRLLLLTQAGL